MGKKSCSIRTVLSGYKTTPAIKKKKIIGDRLLWERKTKNSQMKSLDKMGGKNKTQLWLGCQVFRVASKSHNLAIRVIWYMEYMAPPMCRSAQNDLCGQFQPCTSAQARPTTDSTLNPNANTNPLGGSRSARGRQGQS